ncbi:BlaI/MecI/CopY family transcriptional regulator [Actinomadura sp. NPDC048021]|uniref:BlaI/MecI/CopY family transcriptional regulator n=1 Tax=Actinomadura sp. NPDC048021 TaxID=3155385 RepID=UPI00340EFB8F
MAGGRREAGALESAIMNVLQGAGDALTAAEVRRRLDERLAYSTVVTILSRMHDKGLLVRTKAGRAFRYAPVSDEPGLAAHRMHQVMNGRPDREAVLVRFVEALSGEDERRVRELLEGRET